MTRSVLSPQSSVLKTRGFTLLEVLVALAILGVAVATLATVNHANRMKSERAVLQAHRTSLLRGKLSEALLAPAPTAAEEGDWTPFVDETGAEIEPSLRWKETVTEVRFESPEGGGPLAGRSLWEVRLTVASVEDPEGAEAVSVTAWMEPPPLGAFE